MVWGIGLIGLPCPSKKLKSCFHSPLEFTLSRPKLEPKFPFLGLTVSQPARKGTKIANAHFCLPATDTSDRSTHAAVRPVGPL
ncbi:hypothetical protein H0H93_000313 [Arthromyces matolae]|nr:hypothetical protein H0H93_000313 [Arthromyces matolae]